MPRRSNEELRPRNGHTLMVGIVCRISGCQNQKELSNEDQEDNAKEKASELYDGPTEFRVISTKAKGERLDRPELEQIEVEYRSGEYDLFIYDDIGRLIRGGEAARLLGVGVDHGTRSVCLQDGIDTIDDTWEEDALNACSENVAHNERTSKRIKQKCMNRFRKFGQPTGRPIAGYIVPDGVKSYDGWVRDEQWEALIREEAELLRRTLDCAIVADNFNTRGFPIGKYALRKDWNGPMVRKFYGNSLLKGMPQRGAKHTVKHHGTGRRVSVKNPKGPTFYKAPHLAFFSEEEFDSLNALLDAANEHHRRKPANGCDPLRRRSRKDSQFPAMHSRCWYCGCHHVRGANGITNHLMCSNAREWHCWHSLGFDGPETVSKLVSLSCEQLGQLDRFEDQFREMVAAAGTDLEGKIADERRKLRQEQQLLEKQQANLVAAIKEAGPQLFLVAEIEAIKAAERELLLRVHQLDHHRPNQLVLPESMTVLRQMMEEEFQRLAIDSPAFAKFMRILVPEFFVYAVRLCDGGHLLPRAKVRLNLGGMFPDVNLVPGLSEMLTENFTIDLFEPPQRERIREESVRLANAGMKPRVIAMSIAERPTVTAVQNALALQRMMVALGLQTPYQLVQSPPEDYPKLKRRKHARYEFKPLDGYERREL
jgi:hypothetical protein